MKNRLKHERDYTIIKVVQVTHYQGDVRYVTSRGFRFSCMSLISVTSNLFKSAGPRDKLDLDYILGKVDALIKFIAKFRHLGIEDLPQDFLTENSS